MGRCAELLLIIALSRPSRSFLLPPRSAGSGPPAVAKAATASPPDRCYHFCAVDPSGVLVKAIDLPQGFQTCTNYKVHWALEKTSDTEV